MIADGAEEDGARAAIYRAEVQRRREWGPSFPENLTSWKNLILFFPIQVKISCQESVSCNLHETTKIYCTF